MVLTILTDLKKLFGDYHIYLCMIGLGGIFCLMYICTLSSDAYIGGVVNSYLTISEGSEILLLSFLLCIVGGSFLYCAEEKHSYLNFEIQRVGARKYTISKLITSLIGGFSTRFVANVIFLVGIMIHQWFALGGLYFGEDGGAVMLWTCLFSSLRCAVLSAIGFLVSTYVPNYYIAMTVPLIMYYTILQVEYWVSYFLPVFPERFFFSSIYIEGISGEHLAKGFLYAIMYTACIVVIMYKMARKSIERRLEHA